nr:hypothetical protein [Escherichia coli O25b:H4-ST131]
MSECREQHYQRNTRPENHVLTPITSTTGTCTSKPIGMKGHGGHQRKTPCPSFQGQCFLEHKPYRNMAIVAKLAMRQPLSYSGLTFQNSAYQHFAWDHHNKMLRHGFA